MEIFQIPNSCDFEKTCIYMFPEASVAKSLCPCAHSVKVIYAVNSFVSKTSSA